MRRVLAMLVAVVLLAGVLAVLSGDVTYRQHDFEPLELSVDSGVSVAVFAHGSWATSSSANGGVEIRDQPYVVELQITSGADSIVSARVLLADSVTGRQHMIAMWDRRARSQSERLLMLATTPKIPLTHADLALRGELVLAFGAQLRAYEFSGFLKYAYTEQSRNRFLEALRGI